MRRTSSLILFPFALLLAGCPLQIYDELIKDYPPTGSTSSSTTEMLTPTTTDAVTTGPKVQTVTGANEDTEATTAPDPWTTTTAGPQENAPPKIDLFTVIASLPNLPGHLGEAGPAAIQVMVSDDVVKVDLSLDGEQLAEDLIPADFPRTWEALSAKDNGPERAFKVVVEDAEGLTAEKTAVISVQLPQPGVERCHHYEDSEQGTVISVIAALKYTPKAIVAVGTRGPPDAPRLTVWLLDPDTCQPFPGWPKTIADWTGNNKLAQMVSSGAAVDIDENGNIVAAGNFWVGGKPQSYVVLLSGTGSRLWEKPGQIGEEVTSVAAATAQYEGRVFVGGSQRTSEDPVSTDGMVRVYIPSDDDVFAGPSVTLRAPFTPDEFEEDENNARSEWVRALLIQQGTGNALAVGEREFSPDGDFSYSRAFTTAVHPLGEVVGTPRTSWAPASVNDAVRSIAACGEGFLAGGWTRDEAPGAKPQPMMFWLEGDGTFIEHRQLPQLGATQIHGIACDREGKIVSAGTRAAGPLDARVFTVTGKSDTPVWYESGVAEADEAATIACDLRGFCGWGGYRTANGKPYAVVRVHHP